MTEQAKEWEGWECFKCGESIAERDAFFSYLEFERSVKFPRCPKCGAVFISEEICKKLRTVEEQIEDK